MDEKLFIFTHFIGDVKNGSYNTFDETFEVSGQNVDLSITPIRAEVRTLFGGYNYLKFRLQSSSEVLNKKFKSVNIKLVVNDFKSQSDVKLSTEWTVAFEVKKPIIFRNSTYNFLERSFDEDVLGCSCRLVFEAREEENASLPSAHDFTDISIECNDGSTIRVHQNILMMQCPAFSKAMQKQNNVKAIKFRNTPPKIVTEALRFIYTNKLGDIVGIESEIITLAQDLDIANLVDACIKVIEDKLSIETAVDALIIATEINCEKLKDTSVYFIALNLKAIRQNHSLKKLDSYPELLMKILYHHAL